MGILDEAIREHLELKRQHGAGDSELQELEDQAFGSPARPGAAPSEAAVAEAPPEDEAATTVQPAEPAAEPLPEPVEALEEPVEAPPEPPLEEEQPAIEQPAVEPDRAEAGSVRAETEEHPPPEPPEAAEEPEEIEPVEEAEAGSTADQPTEFYEVEGEGSAGDDEVAVEDEFFSEQSLSDELDQALDAPETPPAPDLAEAPEPESEEQRTPAEEEETPGEDGEEDEEGEDVLEETPEFLQDSPEHDRLWFEQKPPKDFDFDD